MITGAILILTSAILISARSNWIATMRTASHVRSDNDSAFLTVFPSDHMVLVLVEWLAVLSFFGGAVLLVWGLARDKQSDGPAPK